MDHDASEAPNLSASTSPMEVDGAARCPADLGLVQVSCKKLELATDTIHQACVSGELEAAVHVLKGTPVNVIELLTPKSSDAKILYAVSDVAKDFSHSLNNLAKGCFDKDEAGKAELSRSFYEQIRDLMDNNADMASVFPIALRSIYRLATHAVAHKLDQTAAGYLNRLTVAKGGGDPWVQVTTDIYAPTCDDLAGHALLAAGVACGDALYSGQQNIAAANAARDVLSWQAIRDGLNVPQLRYSTLCFFEVLCLSAQDKSEATTPLSEQEMATESDHDSYGQFMHALATQSPRLMFFELNSNCDNIREIHARSSFDTVEIVGLRHRDYPEVTIVVDRVTGLYFPATRARDPSREDALMEMLNRLFEDKAVVTKIKHTKAQKRFKMAQSSSPWVTSLEDATVDNEGTPEDDLLVSLVTTYLFSTIPDEFRKTSQAASLPNFGLRPEHARLLRDRFKYAKRHETLVGTSIFAPIHTVVNNDGLLQQLEPNQCDMLASLMFMCLRSVRLARESIKARTRGPEKNAILATVSLIQLRVLLARVAPAVAARTTVEAVVSASAKVVGKLQTARYGLLLLSGLNSDHKHLGQLFSISEKGSDIELALNALNTVLRQVIEALDPPSAKTAGSIASFTPRSDVSETVSVGRKWRVIGDETRKCCVIDCSPEHILVVCKSIDSSNAEGCSAIVSASDVKEIQDHVPDAGRVYLVRDGPRQKKRKGKSKSKPAKFLTRIKNAMIQCTASKFEVCNPINLEDAVKNNTASGRDLRYFVEFEKDQPKFWTEVEPVDQVKPTNETNAPRKKRANESTRRAASRSDAKYSGTPSTSRGWTDGTNRLGTTVDDELAGSQRTHVFRRALHVDNEDVAEAIEIQHWSTRDLHQWRWRGIRHAPSPSANEVDWGAVSLDILSAVDSDFVNVVTPDTFGGLLQQSASSAWASYSSGSNMEERRLCVIEDHVEGARMHVMLLSPGKLPQTRLNHSRPSARQAPEVYPPGTPGSLLADFCQAMLGAVRLERSAPLTSSDGISEHFWSVVAHQVHLFALAAKHLHGRKPTQFTIGSHTFNFKEHRVEQGLWTDGVWSLSVVDDGAGTPRSLSTYLADRSDGPDRTKLSAATLVEPAVWKKSAVSDGIAAKVMDAIATNLVPVLLCLSDLLETNAELYLEMADTIIVVSVAPPSAESITQTPPVQFAASMNDETVQMLKLVPQVLVTRTIVTHVPVTQQLSASVAADSVQVPPVVKHLAEGWFDELVLTGHIDRGTSTMCRMGGSVAYTGGTKTAVGLQPVVTSADECPPHHFIIPVQQDDDMVFRAVAAVNTTQFDWEQTWTGSERLLRPIDSELRAIRRLCSRSKRKVHFQPSQDDEESPAEDQPEVQTHLRLDTTWEGLASVKEAFLLGGVDNQNQLYLHGMVTSKDIHNHKTVKSTVRDIQQKVIQHSGTSERGGPTHFLGWMAQRTDQDKLELKKEEAFLASQYQTTLRTDISPHVCLVLLRKGSEMKAFKLTEYGVTTCRSKRSARNLTSFAEEYERYVQNVPIVNTKMHNLTLESLDQDETPMDIVHTV